jgi:hypothetical protein
MLMICSLEVRNLFFFKRNKIINAATSSETEFFVTIPKPDPVELGTNIRQTNGSKSSSSEKGHSRNSSADTLLINNSPDPGVIKRTQSNSSLTDQSR